MPQYVVPVLAKIASGAMFAAEVVGVAVTLGTASGVVAAAIGAAAIAASAATFRGLMDLSLPQSDTDKTRQQTVRGTIEPQKLVYGEALVSGPIFFVGVAGTDNDTLYHSIALTGHEVEDITDVYFDNEKILDSQINGSGQVTAGTYGPTTEDSSTFICSVNRRLGADSQTVDTFLSSGFSSNWTSAHRSRGISTITTKWVITDSSQELWDRLTPRDIKALVKGKKDIYDPRLDTSAGANPTNTSYQQWSNNPALCVANYLTDTKFGLSIPASKIDWDAVETAADACDVSVTVPSGTQKRFTANGVLFATDSHRANINKLLSAMNGSLVYSNGIYTIRAGIYAAPTESLTEDQLAGPITVRTSVERGDRFNTVRPIFIDPAQNHKSVEAPEVALTAAVARDNNEVLIRDVQLPFTNSSFMAQRIAHKQIQLSDQQVVLNFPTNLSGLRVDVGDRVSVTVAELNYSNKVFRCAGWSFSDTQDGVVNLTLLEDDSGSYADPASNEYSTRAPSGTITQGFRGVPDPQNLAATAGLKNIELNWTNPVNTSKFKEIVIYASPNSSWANKVEIGRTMGTQFIHDASNSADSISAGDTRYYWVRAVAYGTGSGSFVESDRNPDNDTSNVFATVSLINTTDAVSGLLNSSVSINADGELVGAGGGTVTLVGMGAGDLAVLDTVNAANINVDNLAAISANMGSITAGSMNINSGAFTVSSSGVMTATGATISGAITATSLSLDSSISIGTGNLSTGVNDSLALANSSNQDTTSEILAGNHTGEVNGVTASTVTNGAALGATANQDSTSDILAGNHTGSVNGVSASTVTSGAAAGATAVQPNDTGLTLGIQSGAVGPVSVTYQANPLLTKLFQGTGTFNNSNTGFYLDNGGNFSLKDKLAFNGSTLAVDGAITATSLNISGATVTGSLSADNIDIDGVTLDTDSSGNLIIKDDGVDTDQIKDLAVTGAQIAADTIAVNKLTGDVSEVFPIMIYENQTLTTSQVGTHISPVFTLHAPDLISKKPKLSLRFDYTVSNGSSTNRVQDIIANIQIKSKGGSAVQIGASGGVTVSQSGNLASTIYLSGDHTGSMDYVGAVSDSSSPTTYGVITGLYYDDANDRTYISMSHSSQVLQTGETLYYHPFRWQSAGVWQNIISKERISIYSPSYSTVRGYEFINVMSTFTNTKTDFRLAVYAPTTYSMVTPKFVRLTGTMELIS